MRSKFIYIAVGGIILYYLGNSLGSGSIFGISIIGMCAMAILSYPSPGVLIGAYIVGSTCFYDIWMYAEQPLFTFGFKVYLEDIFTVLILLVSVSFWLRERYRQLLSRGVGGAALCYLAWLAVCVVRGIPAYGLSAIGESRLLSGACIIFPVIIYTRDIGRALKLIKLFGFIATGYVFYTLGWKLLVQYDGDVVAFLQGRALGADTGLIVAAIFCYGLISIVERGGMKQKLIDWVMLIGSAVLMPMCARTAFVAWTVCGGIIVLVNFKKLAALRRMPLVLGLVVLGVVLARSQWMSPEQSGDPSVGRTTSFLDEIQNREGTTGWRIEGWDVLIGQTLSGDYVFGEGLGGYYDLFRAGEKGAPPHNEYLSVFSKMGLVGIALLVNLIARTLWVGIKGLRRMSNPTLRVNTEALLAAFGIGLVGGLFFGIFPFAWIAAGLIGAVSQFGNGRGGFQRMRLNGTAGHQG
jgi:O-antigen ligase